MPRQIQPSSQEKKQVENREPVAAPQWKTRSPYMLSNCNQALVRITDEMVSLKDFGRNRADGGGYRLSWVGYASHSMAVFDLPKFTISDANTSPPGKGSSFHVSLATQASERGEPESEPPLRQATGLIPGPKEIRRRVVDDREDTIAGAWSGPQDG